MDVHNKMTISINKILLIQFVAVGAFIGARSFVELTAACLQGSIEVLLFW